MSKSFSMNLKVVGKPIKVIVLAFALILSWSLFFQSQYNKFSSTAAARRAVEQELSNIENEIQRIGTLSQLLAGLPENNLSKLNISVPLGEQTEDLLNSIDKLAKQAGLTVTTLNVRPQDISQLIGLSVSPGQYVPGGEFGKSDLTVSVEGNYAAVMTFLEALENNARLIDISSLSISSQINQAGQSSLLAERLQLDLTGLVYHLNTLPDTPIFPYGSTLDFTLLDQPQFQALRELPFTMPTNLINQPNPFAP